MTLADIAWPIARAGEALAAVAHARGIPLRSDDPGAPPDRGQLAPWLEEAGGWLGVEVEAVAEPYETIARAIAGSPPALIEIDGAVLAVIGGSSRRVIVLDTELRRHPIEVAALCERLCAAVVAPVAEQAARVIERAGARRPATRAVDALVMARLRGTPIHGIFLVRRPPETALRVLARDRGIVRGFFALISLHAIAMALWLVSWWAIGRSVLGGTVSTGWIAAWGLLLVSSLAGLLAVGRTSGHLGIEASALLSQRLLAGALRIDADELRRDGVGIALGRVLESNTIQSLAITGGVAALLAIIELSFAVVILALGAGGLLHVLVLIGVIGLTLAGMRAYWRKRRTWTDERLELTHRQVEAMVGHATRLAQGDLDALEDKDDRALVRYLVSSRAMDRAQWRLRVLVPLAWPIVAAATLAPALILREPGAGALAAAIGGVLFAAQALTMLVDGSARVVDAAIAWRSIAPLMAAAERRPDPAPPSLALATPSAIAPALTARNLEYRHAGRGAPVLSSCELVIERGERVLIEGASGAGKSTFAAIVAGLRRPHAGLVLASGLDRASVGASGWRRRVACAPQFHDNHVFSAPLAFNLLIGRQWPPRTEDLAAADQLCRELGLGDVLDRMPGGLFQQVGETGWQLSHGERSRIFLARALLQQADVVLLDESLAALDPENLAIAIRCIEAHAPTAIVIAHP